MAVSMFHDADDEELADLLRRAQHGDPVGFDGLVQGLQRPLTGFLRARGAADAEDVANEVLLRVFSPIGSFEGNVAQLRGCSGSHATSADDAGGSDDPPGDQGATGPRTSRADETAAGLPPTNPPTRR